MRYGFALVIVALVSLPLAASAQGGEGYLHLRAHASIADRDGAANARLYVYDAAGEVVHSGDGDGHFAAGAYAAVPPGTYYVDVGRYRTGRNLLRLEVAEAEVTVVPSGWVSADAIALSQQPTLGCSQWNAELNAFVVDPDGREELVITNRGSGVQTWGAVQLAVGQYVVYFNDVPVEVDVRADAVYHLPLGFQEAIYGQRPLLANAPESDANGTRVPLCEDGAIEVPAGTYWTSSIVDIPTYPYERREWNEVTIEAGNTGYGYGDVRTSRLEHPVHAGPGAVPTPLGEADEAALERIGGGEAGGGTIRLPGFGR